MYCRNCGLPIDEGVRYCPSCGAEQFYGSGPDGAPRSAPAAGGSQLSADEVDHHKKMALIITLIVSMLLGWVIGILVLILYVGYVYVSKKPSGDDVIGMGLWGIGGLLIGLVIYFLVITALVAALI